MNSGGRRQTALGALLPAVILGLLLPRVGKDQAVEDSPRKLIEFLTYKTPDRRAEAVAFDCGSIRRDRVAAKALVGLGQLAIPALEEALGSLEASGMRSANFSHAGWLLQAYARIEGPNAFSRLRRMDKNPALMFARRDLDSALALSLGLTSYVSSDDLLAEVFDCTRPGEPRHTLDRFILAWERNDRDWLESSLGPTAKSALNSLLKRRTWAAMRAGFWKRRWRLGDAIGYRFEGAGRWSEPQETLADEREYTDQARHAANPELTTRFTDSAGKECGTYRVRFIVQPVDVPPTTLPYLINNADLAELLRLTASCAFKSD